MTIENRVREVVDEYVARVRHDLDAHVEALTVKVASLAAEQQALREQQAAEEQARQEQQAAEAQARQEQQAAEQQALLERHGAEVRAAAAIDVAREVRAETLQRLLGSVRRIDESEGLNDILEALANAAVDQTSRVAILLVDGEMFRIWGHFGFEEGAEPTEMPIDTSGTLAAALTIKKPAVVQPAMDGAESTSPAFMRVSIGHTGLVVPLSVGGQVVALLYADDMTGVGEQVERPGWTDEVEVLVRHAAVRLENVTSARAVEVLARPV